MNIKVQDSILVHLNRVHTEQLKFQDRLNLTIASVFFIYFAVDDFHIFVSSFSKDTNFLYEGTDSKTSLKYN
jgi:hypothetical protein